MNNQTPGSYFLSPNVCLLSSDISNLYYNGIIAMCFFVKKKETD